MIETTSPHRSRRPARTAATCLFLKSFARAEYDLLFRPATEEEQQGCRDGKQDQRLVSPHGASFSLLTTYMGHEGQLNPCEVYIHAHAQPE